MYHILTLWPGYLNGWIGEYPAIAAKILYELRHAKTEQEIDSLMLRVLHLYLIVLQVPWEQLERFAMDLSAAELQILQKQYDTGIADPKACSQVRRAFAFVSNQGPSTRYAEFTVLPPYIENVNHVVDDTEASLDNGRVVPRQNRIRWPYILGEKIPHLTYKAAMTYFGLKMRRMEVDCNKHFDMVVDVSTTLHGI